MTNLWRSIVLATLLLSFSCPVNGQQAKKVHRIGFLSIGNRSTTAPLRQALLNGLQQLGYIEHQNISIEHWYTENNFDELARELVSLNPDVIVTGGQPAVLAVKQSTKTIPIVVITGDAVGNRSVKSLAHPGGNVTGLSFLTNEVRGKQLELLKEAFPKVSRVAIFLDPAMSRLSVGSAGDLEVGRQIGLQVFSVEVRGGDQLDTAFREAAKQRADALLFRAHPLFRVYQKRVVELAAQSRLPAIFQWKDFVEAGGLMNYGPNTEDLFHRAATYVDKILKGVKPADLPVEQPTKFELVINLKTAKQIGLVIPPNVLARADRVIK